MKENVFCDCCGFDTISQHGEFEICVICYWEDDQYQAENIRLGSGANNISLLQAKKNFAEFGAVEMKFVKNVRSPKKTDKRAE